MTALILPVIVLAVITTDGSILIYRFVKDKNDG